MLMLLDDAGGQSAGRDEESHYLVEDGDRGNGHPRVKKIAKRRCVVTK
jgi:hypothetical protein